VVLRRLAGDDESVNEEWNCDKGRWAFTYTRVGDRITTPMVRDDDGHLRTASWSEAIGRAAAALASARTGVLVGGRVTTEDAYAYAKFARIVLGTNDIDFRARPHSEEESAFLAARVAGQRTVNYGDLDTAPVVVLAGFEPEDESPIVFLRLRKAVRQHALPVITIAPFTSRGSTKLNARVIPTTPGGEAAALDALATDALLAHPGAVILVGERLATSPGALSAAARLADATGAALAWIPRRAGERGALDAGCLPNLLPGGRPVTDPAARRQLSDIWNVGDLPAQPGRDSTAILSAAAHGELDVLLIAGIEPADLADPLDALAAIEATGCVISLELRESAVTALADIVFPVAPVTEKAGSFTDWEGRLRSFEPALTSNSAADLRVLQTLADELGIDLGFRTAAEAREEMVGLGTWEGPRPSAPATDARSAVSLEPGEAVLAGWRMLLDAGRLQDGEPHLAGTARPTVARLSSSTAAGIGAVDGQPVTIATGRGSVTVPLEVTAMPEGVVWLPLNSPGSAVHSQLGVTTGAVVHITTGGTR
jgi:NADH-quinone oxidoreductase subunit G